MFRIPIFKCDWANSRTGVKVEDGFTLVNLHQGQNQFEKDPFIQESQAKQVFYHKESETSNWYVVLKAPSRSFHNLESYDEATCEPSTTLDAFRVDLSRCDDDDDDHAYLRTDYKDVEVSSK